MSAQTLKGTDFHGARLRRDWCAVYVSTSPNIMSIMDSAKTDQSGFIISITDSGEIRWDLDSALWVRSMAKSRETLVEAALKEGKRATPYNQYPVITHRYHEIVILVRGLCQWIPHVVENGQVSTHVQKELRSWRTSRDFVTVCRVYARLGCA
jgi:hypothetical protein